MVFCGAPTNKGGCVMNKSELVEFITEKLGQPKKKIESVVNLIFDMMTDSLVHDGRIEIRGFGSFMTKEYGSYTGRNPRTGDSIEVHPKRLPAFKVGKELRERVNGGPLQKHDGGEID